MAQKPYPLCHVHLRRRTNCCDLGKTYAQLERFDLAIQNLNKALLLKPDYAQPHYYFAQIYRQQGKLDLAAEHFKEAMRLKN